MGAVPPSGTVTLLFTDVEGSTRLWEAHSDAMQVALARHDAALREVVASVGGYVFKTVGDAFCVAFSGATDGVRAAVAAQRKLAAETWPEPVVIRVRMALHTGECEERDGDYFGSTVNRVARLVALGHGGQIVLSAATAGVLGGAPPEGSTLRYLGEYRLKDLATPERVFQVDVEGLGQDFPPLRSLDNPALPNNLPRFPTGLIGREVEVSEVRRLVDANRLVTLTGTAGAGKTRLALQVAADLLDGSGDGVWLVELAAVSDPDRVAATVAGVLGLREDPTQPIVDGLVDALAAREVLVVLDNCEHVIDAVAKLADTLIRSCAGVELIATSREPLGVDGERVYRVPPLFVPTLEASLDEIASADAVRLFVERGRLQQPAFALEAHNSLSVATIVRQLDGIPLALELAAARLRSMSVAEIADRLDQRFRLLTTGRRVADARQHTLRGAIDWSYDLLDNAERNALCRASVFVGGFDLPAAESILADGESVDAFDVVDLVGRLVNKSLIQRDPTDMTASRYRLLESIRHYAAEQLAAAAPTSVGGLRRAYLAHYLAVAEAGGAQLNGPDQIAWNTRLMADRDNFVAALTIAVELPEDPPVGLRLASALRNYWLRNGYCGVIIDALRILCSREAPDTDRATALSTLARAYSATGQARAAYDAADAADAIARRLDDPQLIADAVRQRSWVAFLLGDHATALADANEACAQADETHNIVLQAETRSTRAIALFGVGDGAAARDESNVSITLYRSAGDLYGEANELVNLADYELDADDLDGAAAHLLAAVPLVAALASPELAGTLHDNLGLVAARRGDVANARHHFAAALTTSGRTHDVQTFAHSLIGYAHTIVDTDPTRAAVLQAAGDALLSRLDRTASPNEARLGDQTRCQLEATLPRPDLAAAYDQGRRLSISELLALAVDET